LFLVLVLVLLLVLENADVSPSGRWNKIITGESDSLFAAVVQQIEHEHDDEHEHERTAYFATAFSFGFVLCDVAPCGVWPFSAA
jgi:hypothetical protein